PVMPLIAALYVVPLPVIVIVFVPAAVPAKVRPGGVNPVTASLNTTVKLIGEALVGSACPAAWLIVTVGAVTRLNVTVLSVDVDATFGKLETLPVAAPAFTAATTSPLPVMPLTATL